MQVIEKRKYTLIQFYFYKALNNMLSSKMSKNNIKQ